MKTKRILSFLLSAVMAVSALPAMASAAEAPANLLEGVAPTTTATKTVVEGTGLDNAALAEGETNSFLHFYNMDAIPSAATGEGLKVSFKPVSGVTEYYLRFYARYANDSGNPGGGSYDYIRVASVENATVSGDAIWGIGALPHRGWSSGAGKYKTPKITVSGTGTASVRVYKENRGGSLGTYPVVPMDYDNFEIFYKSGSTEVTLASWDFENDAIVDGKVTYGSTDAPTAWLEAYNYLPEDQNGPAMIEIQSEKDYVKYDDLSGAKGLTYAPAGGIGKGVYKLELDAKMDRFNSVGGEDTFDMENFVTTLTVTDGAGKELAALDVTPEWGASAELTVLSAADSITLTADKAYAIDVAGASLVKLRDVDYTLDADGIIGGANQSTADELGSSSGDNRFMRVSGRKIGAWDGVGFTVDGTFEKDKTYIITLDARTSLKGNKKVALSATTSVLSYGYSSTELNYVTAPTAPFPTYYQAGVGVLVDEGFSTYNFKFTPSETVNELSVSLASNGYYTNRSNDERTAAWNDTRYKDDGATGELTQLPFDVDNIKIYEQGKADTPIFTEDFENGATDKNYVSTTAVYAATAKTLFSMGKGNSIITFDNDSYSTITSADGAPSMKLSDFAGLDLSSIEPGIYRFTGLFRLGYYDGTLDYDKNAAGLTLTAAFKGGKTETEDFSVTADWTEVGFDFYVSEDDAKLSEIALAFNALGEGYTDKVSAVHYKSLAIEEVSLFRNPITVDGNMDSDGYLDISTRSSVTKVDSDADNGYLQVYNRQLGAFDGIAVKLEGKTLTAGETYCIAFDARKSHISDKNVAITVAGSERGANGEYFCPPTVYPQPYYEGSGSFGTVIGDGWSAYVYEYTPTADVTDPVFYFMSNHYWNSRDSWKHWNDVRYGVIPSGGTLPQDNFTANPFDLDNVKIYKKSDAANPIIDDDFDTELPDYYVNATGKSQGADGLATADMGNSKLAHEFDDFYRIDGAGEAPAVEFTDFELEVGKHAFEIELRLPEYDAELNTDKNTAKLTLTAKFSDGSSDTAEFDVTTAFTAVKYPFHVTEDAKLDAVTLEFSAVGEGFTASIDKVDFRSLAVTTQVFEIVSDDPADCLAGASVYSVGDTVVTEVLDENGNPDGFLRVYDRPFGAYDGLGIKLEGESFTAGESYIITFRARKSYSGDKDIALTAALNAKGDNDSYFAPPVNPPAPYQTGNGAVVKEEWQTYTYKFTAAEDMEDPIITLTSNHYYQQRTDSAGNPITNRIEYWNSVRYGEPDDIGSLPQNNFVMAPFDVDDIAVYKEGATNAPIFTDSFENGVSEAYAVSAGNQQGSNGFATYGAGGAKLMYETDVYETVVNEKAAPALVIEDIPALEPGKYVFKAYVRRTGEYDGELPYSEQATSVLTVEGMSTDRDGKVTVKRQTVTVGNDWAFVYLVVEVEDDASVLNGFTLTLDAPGTFDYRGISLLHSPKDEASIPNMGIIMMLLKKREKGGEFAEGGKSDKEISVDRLPNYLDGAMTEEGMAGWDVSGQTLELKTEGTTKYLAGTNIKDNYSGFVYKNGKTLKAGTYLLKLKVRTSVADEKMQIRVYLGDVIKTVRIDNEWKQLEYVLDIKKDTELRFKISGGPLAFYMNSFDMAGLSLVCLDQLAEGQRVTVGGNLFAAGGFEDADALYSWNVGKNDKQGWTGMTVTHRTEADGNGYVSIGNRQANYQNIDLDTGVVVDAGRIYSISFRIRTSDGSSESGIRAYAGTDSSPSYKLKVGNEGSPDPESSWYNSFAVNGEWKEVTATYIAEAGGSLKIRLCGDTSVDSVHDIDLDSIEVYLVFEG